jgi:hypothetical protein
MHWENAKSLKLCELFRIVRKVFVESKESHRPFRRSVERHEGVKPKVEEKYQTWVANASLWALLSTSYPYFFRLYP